MSESLKSVIAWVAEAPWLNRKRLRIYPAIFLVAYILTFIAWVMAANGMVSRQGKPIGVDFECYWAASAMALKGEPAAVYDFNRLHAVERKEVGQSTFIAAWIYPPTFLTVVLPVAFLPYLWALGIWTVATFAGYLAVLRKIVPRVETLLPALAFPGAFANIENGQNGLLTFSLLGGALLSLESRPALAGILFGLLTYKPQMVVLVPLVLMASGRWTAFFSAAITAIAFAGISFVMFGGQTWKAFFGILEFTRHVVIENAGVQFYTKQSVFSAVRLVGGGVSAAYAWQILVAAIAAVTILWIWRQDIQFKLKGSALATGMILVSPYILYYDLVVLALPIAWLGLEGQNSRFLPFEKSLLVTAWLLPLICEPVARYTLVPLTPLVCILLLLFITRRATMAVGQSRSSLRRSGDPIGGEEHFRLPG